MIYQKILSKYRYVNKKVRCIKIEYHPLEGFVICTHKHLTNGKVIEITETVPKRPLTMVTPDGKIKINVLTVQGDYELHVQGKSDMPCFNFKNFNNVQLVEE